MADYICPHCENPIYDEEVLSCHFCGKLLNRAGSGFISNLRYSPKRWIWYVVAGVLFLALLSIFTS